MTTNHNFTSRHIGPNSMAIKKMLSTLGLSSLEELCDRTIPASIRYHQPLNVPASISESEALAKLKEIADQNQIFRSYIGMGYYNCITPPVIQRNILENPGWYTAYTPYQAEIAQGRLEALLNFQTMIIELTGMEIANASLLDEATAAAEAMTMSYNLAKNHSKTFFVSQDCHPQNIAVVKTRAHPLGIEIIIGDHRQFDFHTPIFGALLQYPATDGIIYDYQAFTAQVHQQGGLVTVAADLLSLTMISPPGEFGADIAIGNTQRFGVPLGYGGPHAAYFATKSEYKRHIPGRLVGVSQDSQGKPALRLALQTREQHIRREKATSNICTAQVLLAVIASMYAVYHGPKGLKDIATKIHILALTLAAGLKQLGYQTSKEPFFDTVKVEVEAQSLPEILQKAEEKRINLRVLSANIVIISLDETTTQQDLSDLWNIFVPHSYENIENISLTLPFNSLWLTLNEENLFQRQSSYLTHPVFNSYHSETELLRYIHRLETKDLSLTTSMIPLGSCTMKLNATAEMLPVTWPEFNQIHPYAPLSQTKGYQILFEQLEKWLAEITGFAGVSLQPNAGSQGEYAGLLVIRQYHLHQGEGHRNICLIPQSAHGTNPASAVMCGLQVVVVKCDDHGNIDVADLQEKAEKYSDQLAAFMVTYPSTHGVFEADIKQICAIVHKYGGQVYMDGANMNAQVGLCRPGEIGADVCHLNLHKTFCIPHGGGGPGMGPIAVQSHLVPFLPQLHPPTPTPTRGAAEYLPSAIGMIAAAPWGSASILTISWMYIVMMGPEGLKLATQVAILNANYLAHRLNPYYPVLYKGINGLVAHECILDLRSVKKSAGIEVDDIAKRLMDYGFHAPTVSWPVAGTVMIEPTESESLVELDRFCQAMIAIRQEIELIENNLMDKDNNPLKNAPHTAETLLSDHWERPYPRSQGAYPAPWSKEYKYWPPVNRVDNAYGDRNLVCSCLPIDAY